MKNQRYSLNYSDLRKCSRGLRNLAGAFTLPDAIPCVSLKLNFDFDFFPADNRIELPDRYTTYELGLIDITCNVTDLQDEQRASFRYKVIDGRLVLLQKQPKWILMSKSGISRIFFLKIVKG